MKQLNDSSNKFILKSDFLFNNIYILHFEKSSRIVSLNYVTLISNLPLNILK